MARTVTLQTVVDNARTLADMRHSKFIDTPRAISFANLVYPEFYETLVSAFQNYYTATDTITLVPGTISYDLPDDFYKLIVVEKQEAVNAYSTIFPYNELEKNSTIRTDASAIPNATVRIRYVPAPTVFTALDDTFDGVAGWDMLLSYDLAIMFLTAEESDTSALERKRIQIYQRIVQNAQNRDLTLPGKITDTTVFSNAFIKDELRYRFYGDTLEFLTIEYTGV
jgi:hypothetical protein